MESSLLANELRRLCVLPARRSVGEFGWRELQEGASSFFRVFSPARRGPSAQLVKKN